MSNITDAQRELLIRAAAEPLTDTAGLNPNTAYALIKKKLVMWLPLEGGGSRLLVTQAGLAVLAVAKKRATGRRDVAKAEPAKQGQPPRPESVSGASPVIDETAQDAAEDASEPATAPTDVEPAAADLGAADQAGAAGEADAQTPTTDAPPPARKAKRDAPGGKLGTLVELLKRPEGATVAAMTDATGWQAHSVRGAMSGSLKKKLGLTIVSTKTGETRVYRITSGEAA